VVTTVESLGLGYVAAECRLYMTRISLKVLRGQTLQSLDPYT